MDRANPAIAAMRCQLACALLILSALFARMVEAQEASKSPADIPVEVFAALPGFTGAQMSPDGKYMSFFLEQNGVTNLVIQPLDGGGGIMIPPEGGTSFWGHRWANENFVLLNAAATLNRRVFRGKTTETRWFAYDIRKNRTRWLGNPGKSDARFASQHERIVDMLPDDPDHILMQLDMELDGKSTVYRVKLKTGSHRKIEGQHRGIQNWYTDANSEVRLGTGYNGDTWTTRIRNKDDDWINLAKTDWAKRFDVAGFTEDFSRIFVSGRGDTGLENLYELDLTTGEVSEPVFAHPDVDIDYVFESPLTGRVEGVVFTDDFTQRHYFEPTKARIQRGLDKALPNTTNTILNHVPSKDWYFVLVESDTSSGEYFLYDRPNRSLQFVAAMRPDVDPSLMASTEPVTIPVRDGSTIPGYLTKPYGKDLENLPTIILPHGGPYGVRDNASWDYEAQFYASRGYLVLKPNFRGSGGYGDAFRAKGLNQWGGLMQDDVTDATKWLIEKGYADPERVCIVGSSYGGYAALMGTIKEPGLYKCAISLNGVANLVKLKRDDKRNTIGGSSWTKSMGLKDVEDELVSPHHQAERVSAPVLLMATQDDARVPWTQSSEMHKRLKKFGKKSEFVKIEEGTHYMVTAKSRLVALKAAESFLAKHIGE